MPSSTGSLRSSSSTSGLCSRVSRTASGPSLASPTTADVVLHLEQHRQTLADDGVIISDQNGDGHLAGHRGPPGTDSRTLVPVAGADMTVSLPPAELARSRIEDSPRPACGAPASNPHPSSLTSSTTLR